MTLNQFKKAVSNKDSIAALLNKNIIISESKEINLVVTKVPDSAYGSAMIIPFDLLISNKRKVLAYIDSRVGINQRVFARNCKIKKIDKAGANAFLDAYHIMSSTQSAYNYALYFKDELIAVASFSKGRKMNRLPENKRSYELIRFCCKDGITVTGGLSKMLKHFCDERNAGDVMTYVDKNFSGGESFVKAGFEKAGESEPNYFLVNKKTFERIPLKNKNEEYDSSAFYLSHNSGNIKLIFTPHE